MVLNQKFELILENIKTRKSRQEKENLYYRNISRYLNNGDLEHVEQLFDWSIKLDIHLTPSKIQNLVEILSNLLINCIHNLNLGNIFLILRFFNEYNLFVKSLNPDESWIIQNCYDDKILMKNLTDLFGEITPCFLRYLRIEMPKNLYKFYKESPYFTDENRDRVDYILYFLDRYVIYGLSIQKLGNVRDFLEEIEERFSNSSSRFEKFPFSHLVTTLQQSGAGSEFSPKDTYLQRTHLICPKVLLEMKDKIISKNYNFFNLSMITAYGIGPQGLGFTYSTPKGEIIEICSDREENEAIIIKFKQFLSTKFIKELKSELDKYSVDESIIRKISKHLTNILTDDKLVGYFIKDELFSEIKKIFTLSGIQSDDFSAIWNKVDSSLSNVLRPIEIVDQFKTRMDLVAKKKLRLQDVAKLTSLREKSHYDILRERLFFQYITEWFDEMMKRISKNKKI